MLLLCCSLVLLSPRVTLQKKPWGTEIGIGTKHFDLVQDYWLRLQGGWLHPGDNPRQNLIGNGGPDNKLLVWDAPGKRRESLNLDALKDDWLRHDSYWGGKQDANALRYYNSHGGIAAGITECIHRRSGGALGVLNLHAMGPSGGDLVAQYLVEVKLHPLRVVRRRPLHRLSASSWFTEDRHFYPSGGKLYLVDGTRVDAWDAERDKPLRRVAKWNPGENFSGFAGGRWILARQDNPWRLDALDLQSGKWFCALDPIREPRITYGPYCDESSRYLLFSLGQPQGPNDHNQGRFYTLQLPDGARRPLSGSASRVFGNFAAELLDKHGIRLYSAQSGSLLYRNR